MRRHWAFLIGLLLVLIWAGLFLFHRFESQEVKTLDWRFQRRAAYQVARLDASELRDPDVVLVLITEDCIREHGRWPWDRGLVARLIEEVSEAGAQIIGVDIQYYESSNQRSDGAFQRALERAGNVVLASDIRTEWELDPISFDFRVNLQVNEPLLQFKRAAREMGLVSIDPYVENPDGILRKTPLGKYVQGRYLPSFALNVVSLYLDSPVLADPSGRVLLGTYEVPTVPGKLVAIDEERKNSKPHPLGFEQCIWINYPPVGPEAEFFRRIPARDILAGNSTEDLKGKIVLIGVSALGAERDNKLTVQGLMSGVEFLANIVRNLKNRNALVRLPPAWSVASSCAR